MTQASSLEAPVLIVGAGATGLVAALELARRGRPVRIVERREGPSTLSRAVGILPMSMPVLERLGVADRIRERSVAVRGLRLFDGDRRVADLPLDRLDAGHMRLFCLPQDQTETIFAERLAALGGEVKYGRTFEALEQRDDGTVAVTIDGETRPYAAVLGADGARSSVRATLDLPFEGYDLETRWSIADIDVRAPAEGLFRVHLLADGEVVFVIPIAPHRLRVVATVPDALAAAPVDLGIERVRRAGDFAISVRQVPRYRVGRVALAGDAAHVHSPVGGRGMNLGMADAAEWATRLVEGRMDGYSDARHAAGREIVAFTEAMRRRVMTPDGPARRAALKALSLATHLPPIVRELNRRVLRPGYDEAIRADAARA